MNLLNARQLASLWIGIIAISLMGLVPPWRESSISGNPLDYAPLFSPPKLSSPVGVTVDYSRLGVEWLVAVFVTGGLLASFQKVAPGASSSNTSANVSRKSEPASAGAALAETVATGGSNKSASKSPAAELNANAGTAKSGKGGGAARALRKVRNLSFPGQCIGDLLIESDEDEEYWEFFARAEGQVSVPMDKRVQLELLKDVDANISQLSALPADAFYSIDFSESRLTDADLRHFSHFTEVRELDLSDTSVTDLGIKSLSGLSKLKKVWLDNTAVTDKGLEELANHREIEKVSLIGTHIDAPVAQSLLKTFSSKCELVLENNG